MSTIWKYDVEVGSFAHQIPANAVFLSVQVQGEKPVMWFLVDASQPVMNRTFEVFGTGHKVPDDGVVRRYLGTFQLMHGAFVGHLFGRET